MSRSTRWRRAADCGAIAVLVLAGAWLSASPAGLAAATGAGRCGADVVYPASVDDPGGVLRTLPARARDAYRAWPFAVASSPWGDAKAVRRPWRIGLVMPAIANPWQSGVLAEVTREFVRARADGLVTGTLQTAVQSGGGAASAAGEIAAIRAMVRRGVDGILLLPVGGGALAPAVTAAGRAGVPVVVLDDAIPGSSYAVNVWWPASPPAAAVAALAGRGNVLVVRGPAGDPAARAFQLAAAADVAACPRLRIVGTIAGDQTVTTAKSIVETFLAMHPGLALAAVLQSGLQAAGVIDAYQTAGIAPVPPISDGDCEGADLSWWLAHRTSYRTAGSCVTGAQTAYAELRILFRILAGRGLKLGTIALGPPAPVGNANLAAVATPNEPLDWQGEAKGALDALCPQTCLDAFFSAPGTPAGF